MSEDRSILDERRINPVREGLSETGLYHSFELPDGTFLRGSMPLEWQKERLNSFGLPEDLRGKRVLDIGPWDGWFTFEMEKRGALVTSIDYVDLDTFRALHRAFGSAAHYLQMEVYELDPRSTGVFDIVLCLGVLYHLKHPLCALEKICACTREVCIIDSFVTDGREWQDRRSAPLPVLEFYERDELGGQLDNWCGPNVAAVEALARAAGFARTEVLRVTPTTACVAAHRTWGRLPPSEAPAPVILGLTSHRHKGRSFSSEKEEYIALWCAWNSGETAPQYDEVFPEVDGFGIQALSCNLTGNQLLIGFRLPPGLDPGIHHARLKIGSSGWSERCHFYLDLLPVRTPIHLSSVQDGISWREGEVDWRNGGWATVWTAGLSEEADPGNTTVYVSGVPHLPELIAPQRGQINFRLRPVIAGGEHQVRVVHREVESDSLTFLVTGQPPAIRGLERLSPMANSR